MRSSWDVSFERATKQLPMTLLWRMLRPGRPCFSGQKGGQGPMALTRRIFLTAGSCGYLEIRGLVIFSRCAMHPIPDWSTIRWLFMKNRTPSTGCHLIPTPSGFFGGNPVRKTRYGSGRIRAMVRVGTGRRETAWWSKTVPAIHGCYFL